MSIIKIKDWFKKHLPTAYYPLSTLLIAVFLLSACGYKPSAHSIKKLFGNNIFVEVNVDRAEPENAPYVKDEMNKIVYQRFKGHVSSKAEADTKLYIDYKGSSFTPLTYTNGYVTRYRANIRVRFTMITPHGKLSKRITAIHEADIQESSLTSSTLRIEAIRVGLQKALDEFLAYASAKGILLDSEQAAGSK